MSNAKREAEAREALTAWTIDCASISLVHIAENITFKVDATDGSQYALRFHRPTYHTLEELVSERTWTKALLAAGLDCPVGVETTRGDEYSRARINGEERYVGINTWVEGIPLWQFLSNHEISQTTRIRWFEEIGRLLATFHNQASNWCVPENFTRHTLDADGFMGEKPFWGRFWDSHLVSNNDRDLLQGLRQDCFACLEILPTDRTCFSLIHADMHPGNLIKHGNGLHVIDFDDAGFGWHLYDIAVALIHYDEEDSNFAYCDALLRGYEQLRNLPANVIETLQLFYLVRELAHIGWITARPELKASAGVQENMDYVRENGERILREFSNGKG